jgi:hypothetical protein
MPLARPSQIRIVFWNQLLGQTLGVSMKRRRGGEWVAQNDVLLALPDTPLDRVSAAMLTSLIGEGARQVASAPNRRQASRTIEAVLVSARRLLADGPWHPDQAGRR